MTNGLFSAELTLTFLACLLSQIYCLLIGLKLDIKALFVI